MKTMLELLLEREIQAALDSAADDTNAEFLTAKIIALRWTLAKVRRRQRRQGGQYAPQKARRAGYPAA